MKILYFSLVDWFWIKQRPHHIAEGLAGDNDVFFVCKRILKKSALTSQANNNPKLLIHRFFGVPVFLIKNDFLLALSALWIKIYFVTHRLKNFDRIILTHPLHYRWIPRAMLKNSFVVYDCMDSYSDFNINQYQKRLLNKLEGQLIQHSDAIVFSSQELKKRLTSRYKGLSEKQAVTINNGADTRIFSHDYIRNQPPLADPRLSEIKMNYRAVIGYAGTISSWIDWSLIQEAATRYNDLAFCFIGPTDSNLPKEILKLENVHLLGPVEYRFVPLYLDSFDILLYPFVKNELILAVNPVKVYEYLALNKPVICVRYEETLQFAGYVELYDDREEFFSAVEHYLSVNERPDARPFALNSSWEARIKKFKRVLNLQ